MIKNHSPAMVCIALAVSTCAPEESAEIDTQTTDSLLTIYTVNYPLQYFAERIAGDTANVLFPAPSDADPVYWDPTDAQIAAYQQADIILLNGADFAKWVPRSSLPESKVVDTAAGVASKFIEINAATVHSHGPEGKHAHAGYDFNTWLDPTIAAAQATAIAEALSEKIPSQEEEFNARLAALESDLMRLDEALDALSEAHPDVPLIASHPVYNYLARRYNWNLRSLHWEPDEMPEEAEWKSLETLLGRRPATFVIWEGDPNPAIAERLKSIGLRSVVFYPLGNRPKEGDYLSAMEANIERFRQGLEGN